MSVVNVIKNADRCLHKPLLCWVNYPQYGGRNCFVYPCYAFDAGGMCSIDSAAFPDDGAFTVYLTGGHTVDEARDEYGSIVVATVNEKTFPIDDYYGSSDRTKSQYRCAMNLSFQPGKSEVDFDRLSNNPLSSTLLQVVHVAEPEDFNAPTTAPLTISDGLTPLTKQVMMVSASGALVGPFEYEVREDGSITIKASSDATCDNRITHIRPNETATIPVKDHLGREVATFVTKASIDTVFKSKDLGELVDWITDSEIIEVANRAISTATGVDLSKSQLRALKNAIRTCSNETARLHLDDSRRRRVEQVLDSFEFWLSAPDSIDRLAASVSPDVLGNVILSEENYPAFQERVLANPEIKERVDAERKRLEANLEEIRGQIASATSERDELLRQAEVARGRLEQMQQEAREVALAEKEEELREKNEELEDIKRKIQTLNDQCYYLEQRKRKAEDEVRAIFSSIDEKLDGVQLSEEIIHSEMLRKVVATISGESSEDGNDADTTAIEDIVFDEELSRADTQDLVDVMYARIAEDSGRSYSRNDVINFLICLTQGYITTFAGNPGTGKTSLCEILAGSLGLRYSSQRSRYAKLSVEKGWANYKDYVGYYNPLTKGTEKAIPDIFDAMARLNAEREATSEHAPFIFLLDEANLSPIEHYWAPFLHACDYFLSDGATLSLGGDSTWIIPSWTRFLATVNFDHTTEALSPRFLDRSWVISLEPDFVEFDPTNARPDYSSKAPIPYARLIDAFGGDASYEPDTSTSTLMNDIFRRCKEAQYPVSPRSQSMIARYLSTASALMDRQSRETQQAPLDYAIAQKVLPMLSGPTDQLKPLLDGLADSCSSLTITSRKLRQMREAGDANGFYQYFV